MAEKVVAGEITIPIEPDIRRMEALLRDARGRFVATAKQIEARAMEMQVRTGGSFAALGARLAAVFGSAGMILGGGLAGVGIAAVAATRGVSKLEDAFANLRKVVSDEAFPAIQRELMELGSQNAGASLETIVALATAARKLGVADEDLVRFTRGLSMLAVAVDDIPADELAVSVARILNVTNSAMSEAAGFGSALNKLADNAATSAGEILTLTNYLAPAASALGASYQQILALATAMKSVGASSEITKTAFTNIMIAMVTDTQRFATVAGMGLEEFQELIDTNIIGALHRLGLGLSALSPKARIEAIGHLGQDASRTTVSLLQLGKAADKYEGFLQLANAESQSQASILRETAVRAETLSARFNQLWNRIKQIAFTVYRALQPVLDVFFRSANRGLQVVHGAFQILTVPMRAIGNLFAWLVSKTEGLARWVSRLVTGTEAWQRASEATAAVWERIARAVGMAEEKATVATDAGPGGKAPGAPMLEPEEGTGHIDFGAMQDATDAAEELQRAFDGLFQELVDEAGILMFGAGAWEDYRLRLMGATDAQMAQIAAMRENIAAAEELKRKEEEAKARREENQRMVEQAQMAMENAANAIYDATRTPLEKLQGRLAELRDMLEKGLLSDDTFNRATAQARADFADEAARGQKKSSAPEFLGAMEFARRIATAGLGGKDKNTEIAANTGFMAKRMDRLVIMQEQLLKRMMTGQRIMV